jgi:hypothetical protein
MLKLQLVRALLVMSALAAFAIASAAGTKFG